MNEVCKVVFGLAGGLALFLYGMNSMSDALQKAAGEKMKKILEFLTKNPIMGVAGRSTGYSSAAEQFCNYSYGDWFCQRRTDESATGNFCYFWCQYWYNNDCTAYGI